MTSADTGYPMLDVFWTIVMLWFWVIFIWLLVMVLSDIFRRADMGGGAKALWVLFVVLLPFLGAFVYLLTAGREMMHDRQGTQVRGQRHDGSAAPRPHDGRTSSAEQIARAKELLDSGAITPDEYATLKRKAMAA